MAHGLFSWMGAASEGGYLGSDSASFFSAMVSGVAGSCIVMLTADAGIGADLVIQPGQDVRITGDPGLAAAPSWAAADFQSGGPLALTKVRLLPGASLTIIHGWLDLVSLVLPGPVLAHQQYR